MKKVVWPLILISLGLLFLLNNLGLLSWSAWNILWRFWPIFLILSGLELVLGDSSWSKVILATVCLITLEAALFFTIIWPKPESVFKQSFRDRAVFWSQKIFPKNKEQEFVITNESYPSIDQRILKVNVGLGRLTIADQEENPNLFYLRTQYQDPFGVPRVTSDLGSDKNITISFDNRHNGLTIPSRLTNQINYQIILGQVNLPTRLYLKMGAGQADIGLNQIITRIISLETGAGQISLRLSESALPEEKLAINLGAGKIKISLPQNSQINLDYNIGAGKIVVNQDEIGGLNQTGRISVGQNEDLPINIEARIGAGSLIVDYQ
ncbi:MAG: DUF5668 domain-containing protein [Candidatus Shapirobacteria bacterium]|nr:DUF5668 domain-containing protein [Candidatus Shapirobacteria bacterium]MDD5073601.1 DUF5668 domain-containing protein [Candidatus Shapirobacteria bacterium]MDD5481354.1 DUF5668 domain-containing protein [Candidatus Shapirobacteria bacterium]